MTEPDTTADGPRPPVRGTASAVAHPNLALVKNWGKRNPTLNIPATGSISATLGGFASRTRVTFFEEAGPDRIQLNGQEADSGTGLRICRFLDLVRREAGFAGAAEVVSDNDFPTAAGLASSASGFAALALASCRALRLDPSPGELSILARRGSGSAARSLHGGFVELKVGSRADGLDTVAVQLAPEAHWDLRVVVAITREEPKEISTTEGMVQTADTSPYYPAWVSSHEPDLGQARQAILARDIEALGQVAECSTLKLHGAILAARPGVIYWNGATVEVLTAIRQLRRKGLPVFFTVDAGPQVKVFCLPEVVAQVEHVVAAIPGVRRVLVSGMGGAAQGSP